jgi:adenine-specific DNA-methyltransferase
MTKRFIQSGRYASASDLTIRHGDCLRFLKSLPNGIAQLILTSPPYNVGKEYEIPQSFAEYLEFQRQVIGECTRVLKTGGSICWQLGNYLDDRGDLIPLDAALYPIFCEYDVLHLRNRVIWRFAHGLHCRRRFSGRYETILWYTKGDEYLFNLDSVRIPQKYPGKLAFRGPRRGMPTGNPLGKNPGDVWDIPNVKGNHIEKTPHPCQFPIALAETLILALTNRGHLVIDPFLGAGTTVVAALKNGRRGAGAELCEDYIKILRKRVRLLEQGELAYRPRLKPVYVPAPNTRITTPPNGFLVNGHGPVSHRCKDGKTDTKARDYSL